MAKIEKYLRKNNNSLPNFQNAPVLDEEAIDKDKNHLILVEKSYDREKLKELHTKLMSTVTGEQKGVYETISTAVQSGVGGMFFLYGFGGTGKTFCGVFWELLFGRKV